MSSALIQLRCRHDAGQPHRRPLLTILYDKDRIAALQPLSAMANRYRIVVYRQLDDTLAC